MAMSIQILSPSALAGDLPSASADFAGGIKYQEVPYDKNVV